MTRMTLLVGIVLLLAVASPYAGFIPGWSPGLATNVAFTALALIGLNLIFGVAGMLAFGQAAFMVIPAYFGGVLQRAGVAPGLSIAIGFVAAVLLARILAEFFVRLPGIYLAFGTLGFGYVVEGLARAFPGWTGGASGLVFASGRAIDQNAWYAISIITLGTGLIIYAVAVRGARWRRLRTIRHDELVAAALGIDVMRAKVRTFTLGCLFAAVAGTLLCYYVGVVVPDDAGAQRSLSQIGMVMMGGPALTFGPVVGAFLVAWLFFVAGAGGHFESLVYGIVFLVAVLYAKNGLLGFIPSAPRDALFKRRSPGASASFPAAIAPPKSEVCLRVYEIGKRFQGLTALEGIGFDVSIGEVFALVGPNGAGKSTLFNIICGLIEPTSGSVHLRGTDITTLPIHRRAPLIGRAFQVARLIPELTAAENVLVRIDNIAPDLGEEVRRAVALAQLEAFDLLSLADTAVSTLSIGQHKLIDVARAAAGDPPLVLLDEPAVGLTDSELLHLRRLIIKLRDRGTSVLIVEHNIDFASSVASRGLVLDSGRVVTSGPMNEILADERVQTAYFGALT
jgi:branched-chain amino acid transport system permease protein